MGMSEITEKDRARAQRCVQCVVCRHARKKQRGALYWVVRAVEGNLCPYCRAYEKVYGRKAHEPLPSGPQSEAEPGP